MVRSDWVSVGIPKGLIMQLDQFLETDEAKKIGVSNRQQIITLLLREFFEKGFHMFDESEKIKDPIIKQLEEKFEDLQNRLEKHERLFTVYGIGKITSHGSSEKTALLHGEKGQELITKADPPNAPHEITVYETTKLQKLVKDNLISGLIAIKIRKDKISCSHDKKNNSCSHIKFALQTDPFFVKQAIMKNVKNPILDKIISKTK